MMIVLSNNYKVIETNDSSITIRLSRWLASGTDSGCEQFVREIDALIKTGKVIKIDNQGWIPIRTNTIDAQVWNRYLMSQQED